MSTEDTENGNTFLSTEGTEGHGERLLLFGPRRTRRGAEDGNFFLSAEDAEEHGERQLLFGPRRTRRGAEKGLHLFVHGGHGGARRTATAFWSAEDAERRGGRQLLFVRGGRGGTRRTATPFCPRRTGILGLLDGDDSGELLFCLRRARRTAYTILSGAGRQDHICVWGWAAAGCGGGGWDRERRALAVGAVRDSIGGDAGGGGEGGGADRGTG